MARYSAGGLTSAGSITLPLISLYSAAAVGAKIREIGVTNTTSTAVALKLVRLSTTGTQGGSLTAGKHDPESAAASAIAYNTHSVAPTASELGYRTHLGAAVGAAFVWTFWSDTGLRIPVGVTSGLGVMVENGTGQALQAYIVWDE